MRRIAVSQIAARAKAARDEAEREGYAANKAGETVGQNPHKSGPAWTGWRVGWYRANGEQPDRAGIEQFLDRLDFDEIDRFLDSQI